MDELPIGFRDQRREMAPGQLQFSLPIQLSWPQRADTRVGDEILHHPIEAVVQNLRVAVEKQDKVATRVVNPEIVGLGKPQIGPGLDASRLGRFGSNTLEAIVLRSVV